MVAERRGVRVIHGANDGIFDVAGYPLTRLRSSLVDAFNIPLDAVALANGRRVPQSYEPVADDVIEFIREQGMKGGRKKLAAPAPDDDGDDEEVGTPDFSTMSLDGLAAYIDGRFASSHAANERSLLQAHKSAVELFWAGAALYEARAKCEQEGRGRWKAFKEEHSFKDTTVNDAIRLFENAKTPDALIGLGITEAKTKFVYPPKDEAEQKTKPVKPKATKRKPALQPDQPPPVIETPDEVDAGDSSEEQEEDEGDEFTVIDPAETVAETLEDIAQQLNEITQDYLGKVDLTKEVSARLMKAVQAVADALQKLCRRIDHDRKDA